MNEVRNSSTFVFSFSLPEHLNLMKRCCDWGGQEEKQLKVNKAKCTTETQMTGERKVSAAREGGGVSS